MKLGIQFKLFLQVNLLFFLVVFLVSCQSFSESSEQTKKERAEKRNGLHKSYYKDKKLRSEINYKDGRKHGIAKQYYKTGELHSTFEYNEGTKHGEVSWYYESGQVYLTTSYKNGVKNGEEKKYFKDGSLKSQLEYLDGEPSIGLKEYKPNGDLLNQGVKILIKEENKLLRENLLTLRISLSKKMKDIRFYMGELKDGKFMHNKLNLIQSRKNNG